MRFDGLLITPVPNSLGPNGVIVAKSMDDKSRYAALRVPNVTLLEYEIDFKLRPAGLLGTAEV